MKTIRIGTRKSKLAIWQASFVAEKLEKSGFDSEIILQETRGDQILDVSISKIGSKGVFTAELEETLANGTIDIAVHSAKDLESNLADEFEIIAFTERETVNDVIVADKDIDLNSSKLVLGTSSTRRIALFKHFHPHINLVDIRGNLQTRIAKMRSGLCHGLVLAYAGVHRMDQDDLIRYYLPVNQFIPPVGQGSVAVEAHKSLKTSLRNEIRAAVNHSVSEQRLLAERAFLATLNGGCSIPVFALCETYNDRLIISGGIVSLNGQERLVEKVIGQNPIETGKELAQIILMRGGDKILSEIRKQI